MTDSQDTQFLPVSGYEAVYVTGGGEPTALPVVAVARGIAGRRVDTWYPHVLNEVGNLVLAENLDGYGTFAEVRPARRADWPKK